MCSSPDDPNIRQFTATPPASGSSAMMESTMLTRSASRSILNRNSSASMNAMYLQPQRCRRRQSL